MSTMTRVPEDHPMMAAWRVYSASPEYANSFRWAAEEADKALWRKAAEHIRCKASCGTFGGYGYCTCGAEALLAKIEERKG